MTLKLNGSTDGSVSIDAPADTSPTGSDITLTLPTSAGSANEFIKNGGTAGELEYSSMVETSTGVGIGTSSPSYKLHVTNDSSAAARIGGASNYLELGEYASNSSPAISYNGSGASLPIRNGTSEVARFDSSGRLLVGTSSARANFLNASATGLSQVEGSGSGTSRGLFSVINNAASDYPATLLLGRSKSDTVGSNTLTTNNNWCGRIGFMGNDGSEFVELASISGFVDGGSGSNDMPGRLSFRTTSDGAASPTERLRINKDGYVQVQANSAGDVRFQFNGNGTRIQNTTSGGHMDFYTNSAVRNRFLYNGQGTVFSNQSRVYPETDNAVDLGSSGQRYDDVFATNGTIQTSDSRLKREVETSVLGIDFVKALRPVSYKWIEGKKVPIVDGTDENGDNIYRTDADGNWVYESRDGARRHWGFIAQEVKQAVDDASVDFAGWSLADKDDPDSTQSLRYEEFIAPLTKALQEAITKVETLETQNTAQQAQIDDLLARVTALEAAE